MLAPAGAEYEGGLGGIAEVKSDSRFFGRFVMPQARSYGLGFRHSPSWATLTSVPGETKPQKLRRWAFEKKRARKRKYVLANIDAHRKLQPGALLPRLVKHGGPGL